MQIPTFWKRDKAVLAGFVAAVACAATSWTCGSRQLQVLAEDVPTAHALRDVFDDPVLSKELGPEPSFILDKYEVMTKKAFQDLANKSGVYDLILDYNTGLATYTRNNYVYTFDDLKKKFPTELNNSGKFPFEDKLFREAWEEVGWYGEGSDFEHGHPVAIPFAANTMLLVFNKKMFGDPVSQAKYLKQAGHALAPPETWEEFRNIARFFTKGDGSTFGVALQGDPYFIYYEWANLAYGMDGGVMKKHHGWQGNQYTSLLIDSPETRRATELYLSLKPYNGSRDFFSTDALKQRDEVMKKGNTAMALMWSDVVYDLAKSDPRGETFGYRPIPGKVSMLAGGSFYVNRESKRPEKAMRLVLNYMRPEVQQALLRRGLCSPSRDAYSAEIKRDVPYAVALETSLARGVYMLEAGPDSEAVIGIVGKTLQEIWKGKPVDQALTEAKNEISTKRQEIFSQLGKSSGK